MPTTLILGGTSHDQLRHARHLLPRDGEVNVVRVGGDPDSEKPGHRINAPRDLSDLPEGWTVQHTDDITRALLRGRCPSVVDGLDAWVIGMLDQWNGWEKPEKAAPKIEQAALEFSALWGQAPFDSVALSREGSMGLGVGDPKSRIFVETLNKVNTIVTGVSKRTHLIVAGRVVDLSDAPVIG